MNSSLKALNNNPNRQKWIEKGKKYKRGHHSSEEHSDDNKNVQDLEDEVERLKKIIRKMKKENLDDQSSGSEEPKV